MKKSSIEDRLNEFHAFRHATEQNKGDESELAQVLIAASYLDGQLRNVLSAFFAENTSSRNLLEGPNAPIGSFSSRVSLSYSLGLITQREYLSIQAIRQIRNKFAHELTASFDDPALTKRFDALAWAALRDKVGDLDRSELLFIASSRLGIGLVNRADHVAEQRRVVVEWPNHRIDSIDVDPLDLIY